MNDDLIKIRQLQKLAELKLNTELARLKDIAREKDVPNAVLNAIVQEKKCHDKNAESKISQSMISGMDVKWQVWAERKTRDAMGELARIAQQQEDQMLIAKQAFGRTEALKFVVRKTKIN